MFIGWEIIVFIVSMICHSKIKNIYTHWFLEAEVSRSVLIPPHTYGTEIYELFLTWYKQKELFCLHIPNVVLDKPQAISGILFKGINAITTLYTLKTTFAPHYYDWTTSHIWRIPYEHDKCLLQVRLPKSVL